MNQSGTHKGEIMMETKQIEIFLLRNIQFDFETVTTNPKIGDAGEYVVLGSGTATITMLPEEAVVKNQVEGLKKSKQTVLANCQLEIESIDDRIQSLLAIAQDGVEA